MSIPIRALVMPVTHFGSGHASRDQTPGGRSETGTELSGQAVATTDKVTTAIPPPLPFFQSFSSNHWMAWRFNSPAFLQASLRLMFSRCVSIVWVLKKSWSAMRPLVHP